MELAIPLIALGGLYMASKGKKEEYKNRDLPNTNIPDTNYPEEYPVEVAELDRTSRLSTVNKYDTPSVYTDKYFEAPAVTSNESFTSMTGQQVNSEYFKHNNMTPYFGSKNRSVILESNATESILDNYSGSGTQYITKQEQSPLFSPGDTLNYAYGAPNSNDFYQSRVNSSMRMANVKPFDSIQVGPGLGKGGASEGSGGYNSGMAHREQWLPKTVDELRIDSKPRSSGFGLFGHEGPANSSIKTMADSSAIGKVEKNRVERAWDMGPERYFTTTGVVKGQTLHSIPVERNVKRPETSTSYVGVAGAQAETYNKGEYMESKHMDLGEYPLGIATMTGQQGGTTSDYEMKAKRAYPNNRSVQFEDTYFGAFSGAIGSVIAPLLDELRPSRKENVLGTLRPYQNAHTGISSSYLLNPRDRPAPTIRETTGTNKYVSGVNTNQRGGGYETNDYQSTPQQRDSTSVYYAGSASDKKGLRPYDAEYRQRNNDIKSSTIQGHMVKGNMNLLNNQIEMRNRDGEIKNQRPLVATNAPLLYGTGQMGDVHTKQQYQSTIQIDRNTPDMLNAFRQNPYTHNF